MMAHCPSCSFPSPTIDKTNEHVHDHHKDLYLDRMKELQRRNLPHDFPVGVPITRLKSGV